MLDMEWCQNHLEFEIAMDNPWVVVVVVSVLPTCIF